MKNIFVLLLTINSLFQISSCSINSGCEMNYPCNPIDFGIYKPNDSTSYWVPKKIDSITLTNSNGFFSALNFTIINENYQEEISYRSEPVSNECGTSLACSDYCFKNYLGWNLLIGDINTNIKMYRMPKMSVTSGNNILRYKPKPSEIYTTGDLFIAEIGYRTFSTDFSDCIFLNSIILNKVEYNNVYVKTFSNKYAEPIYVNKVYFNKGLGLVGYELSNNEIWNLKIK